MDSEDSIAKTGRDFCDKLFSIEAEFDSLTSEERYNKRLTQEKEVFEAFWSWAEKNISDSTFKDAAWKGI